MITAFRGTSTSCARPSLWTGAPEDPLRMHSVGGPSSSRPMVVAVLSGTSAVVADSDAMVGSGRHAVHRSNTGTHTDAHRGRRWTVCAAALVVIASTVFLGTLFAQAAVAPGYATWQDKTSTLLRAVGM